MLTTVNNWSCEVDLGHAEEEPSEQTPISTHLQNKESCLGWYYLIDGMSINQFALAIWYPCYFSNNLNVWKLYSTIAEKREEAEASNAWNFAWQNEKINGRIEDPISIAKGNKRPHDPVQAAKFASEAGVVIKKKYQFWRIRKNTRGRSPAPSIAQDLWKG